MLERFAKRSLEDPDFLEAVKKGNVEKLEELREKGNINLDFRKLDLNGALQHVKLRDFTVPRSRGIGGAHDMNEFAKYSSECKIISETPNGSVPGVEKIEYQLTALDKYGNPTGGYKAKVFEKTVYYPKVWTDKKLIEALKESLEDAALKNNGIIPDEFSGLSKSGYRIRGYYRNGKVDSFFFE